MVEHRGTRAEIQIQGGRLAADDDGLRLVHWLFRRGVLIPWQQIDYVSPVSGLRAAGGGWNTFRGAAVSADALRARLRFYCIYVVLKDRGRIRASCSMPLRLWLQLRFLLRPLYDDRGKPDPQQGCLRVWLMRRPLRKSPERLLELLGWIQRRSRFDIVVVDD
jgi:hypothetical protein